MFESYRGERGGCRSTVASKTHEITCNCSDLGITCPARSHGPVLARKAGAVGREIVGPNSI